MDIRLVPLTEDDREQFILDNQEAFNYGALQEFGCRDDQDGEKVGGVILKVEGDRGDLEILFVSPKVHSKGIGYAAWCEVEKMHPEVKIWETVTPYFEKRNIHFYVNRCGFHIVEFFNSHHPDPNDPDERDIPVDDQFPDGMFRFEKKL